jgi:hypothetical protein
MLHNEWLDGAGLFGAVIILMEFSEPIAMVAIGVGVTLATLWGFGVI